MIQNTGSECFLQVLDSLSVHSKMSLIHSIVTHILKQVMNTP